MTHSLPESVLMLHAVSCKRHTLPRSPSNTSPTSLQVANLDIPGGIPKTLSGHCPKYTFPASPHSPLARIKTKVARIDAYAYLNLVGRFNPLHPSALEGETEAAEPSTAEQTGGDKSEMYVC